MITILYVLNGPFRCGGTEAVVLNYYNYINKSEFHIDFAVHALECDCRDNPVHQQLSESGASFYYITPRSVSIALNRQDLKQLFSSVHYDIIHTHMDTVGTFVLSIAKKSGIPVRIAHSHNTSHQITINSPKKFLHFLYLEYCRLVIRKIATNYMACSTVAGIWMFGRENIQKTYILNNAIDSASYAFSYDKRVLIRQQLQLDNHFVIGHVGRISRQKNHSFLIDVFKQIHDQVENSVLLLVGDGDLADEIKAKVSQLHLDDSVIFYGSSNQVADLMQAMDIFILPSLFEGLGIVSIEAQAAGLKVFSSTEVPRESAIVNDLVHFIPLSDSPYEWSRAILSSDAIHYERQVTTKTIAAAGYDIKNAVFDLESYYRQCANHPVV